MQLNMWTLCVFRFIQKSFPSWTCEGFRCYLLLLVLFYSYNLVIICLRVPAGWNAAVCTVVSRQGLFSWKQWGFFFLQWSLFKTMCEVLPPLDCSAWCLVQHFTLRLQQRRMALTFPLPLPSVVYMIFSCLWFVLQLTVKSGESFLFSVIIWWGIVFQKQLPPSLWSVPVGEAVTHVSKG